MDEFTVIVIPEPDENGTSPEPYLKRVKSYNELQSLVGGYFDVFRCCCFPNSRSLDAYVDDEGKLKGRRVNNTFMQWADASGLGLCQTIDGTVLLSLSNEGGESVDFMTGEAEALLNHLIKCCELSQGVIEEPSEPVFNIYSFD